MSLYNVVYDKNRKPIAVIENDIAFLMPLHPSDKRADGVCFKPEITYLTERLSQLSTDED